MMQMIDTKNFGFDDLMIVKVPEGIIMTIFFVNFFICFLPIIHIIGKWNKTYKEAGL